MIGLDSSFIIDFFRGEDKAIKKAKEILHQEILVTPITVAEVFTGIFLSKRKMEEEERIAHAFFDRVEILSFTPHAAKEAARLQARLITLGKEMESTDAMIAAILMTNGCNTILSRDHAFKRIDDLIVEGY